MPAKTVSIVVPVYNEQDILPTLHSRLDELASGRPYSFEFVFVSDGSSDGTLPTLIELSRKDPRVLVVDLARNFGQHPALSAGIDAASGDAVILMDADMEDDPSHLSAMIAAWEEGYEVVYGLRGKRSAGLMKTLAFKTYHAITRMMRLPEAGTFCLMDRRVADVLRLMPERNRYIPGLRAWAGYRQKGITFDRGSRYDGSPRVSWMGLMRLALNSFVSFTKIPLKVASMAGMLLFVVGLLAIAFLVIYQLLLGFQVSGWASLMVTVIFASGIQLLCLGILGEYVGQILDEVKGRPVYLVRACIREGKAQDAAVSVRPSAS